MPLMSAEIARALPQIPISQAGGVTSPFVRTHGIVTAVGSEDFWLSDSEGGLNVYCGFPPAVTIGQSLELLGAPGTRSEMAGARLVWDLISDGESLIGFS